MGMFRHIYNATMQVYSLEYKQSKRFFHSIRILKLFCILCLVRRIFICIHTYNMYNKNRFLLFNYVHVSMWKNKLGKCKADQSIREFDNARSHLRDCRKVTGFAGQSCRQPWVRSKLASCTGLLLISVSCTDTLGFCVQKHTLIFAKAPLILPRSPAIKRMPASAICMQIMQFSCEALICFLKSKMSNI